MRPHNVMEDIVLIMLNEFKDSLNLECNCESCLMDVLAITLNHIPPQYVNKPEGFAYIKAKYMSDQNKTNILCELARAAKIVKENVRHA